MPCGIHHAASATPPDSIHTAMGISVTCIKGYKLFKCVSSEQQGLQSAGIPIGHYMNCVIHVWASGGQGLLDYWLKIIRRECE